MSDGDTVTATTSNNPMETAPNQGERPAEADAPAESRVEPTEPSQTQAVPETAPVEATDPARPSAECLCAEVMASSAGQAAAVEPVNPTVRDVHDRLADVSRIRFGVRT